MTKPVASAPRAIATNDIASNFTPLTPIDMGQALLDAYIRVFGKPPSRNCLTVAWAQCALETGQGKKMRQFNFGNLTATKEWTGKVYGLRQPNKTLMRFRAYDDAAAGAEDYWRFIAARYPQALRAFERGAEAAALQFGKQNYFPPTATFYAGTMKTLGTIFAQKFSSQLAWPSEKPADGIAAPAPQPPSRQR